MASPKAPAASRLAPSHADANPSGPSTRRIAAQSTASSSEATAPPLHAATGTPTPSARSLAPILSPSRRMTEPGGPMNTTPKLSQRSENAACSATNPHPTHTASAPVARSARSSSP